MEGLEAENPENGGKHKKSYPEDFRVGQTLSFRIDDKDIKHLKALYKLKQFTDIQSCLRFAISEARKRNCW